MDHQVFISYSSRDSLLAERICDRLERDGVPCWISCRDVPPGADFQDCIVRAIDAAELVLLVFSSEANHSNEIAKELSLASKKLLIPARIEDVLPEGAFRFQLSNRQFFDLFQDFDQRLDQLSKLVQSALAGHGLTMPPLPARPRSPSPAWRWPLLAAAVLAVAATAWWLLRTAPAVVAADRIAGEASPVSPAPVQASARPPAASDLPPRVETMPAASAAAVAAAALPPADLPPPPLPQPSAAPAARPSFDCAKATTRVELAICGDARLSQLDTQLSQAYRNARIHSTDRGELQRRQNLWLRQVRDACMDAACIAIAHEQRIRELGAGQ